MKLFDSNTLTIHIGQMKINEERWRVGNRVTKHKGEQIPLSPSC
jgi:hypothetical protein